MTDSPDDKLQGMFENFFRRLNDDDSIEEFLQPLAQALFGMSQDSEETIDDSSELGPDSNDIQKITVDFQGRKIEAVIQWTSQGFEFLLNPFELEETLQTLRTSVGEWLEAHNNCLQVPGPETLVSTSKNSPLQRVYFKVWSYNHTELAQGEPVKAPPFVDFLEAPRSWGLSELHKMVIARYGLSTVFEWGQGNPPSED